MTFKLEIELGNAAMCNTRDVADALHRTADKLNRGSFHPGDVDCARVMDLNGNGVGTFEFEAGPGEFYEDNAT